MPAKFAAVSASVLALPLAVSLTACSAINLYATQQDSPLATAKNDTEACQELAKVIATADSTAEQEHDVNKLAVSLENISEAVGALATNKNVTAQLRDTSAALSPYLEKVVKLAKDGKVNVKHSKPKDVDLDSLKDVAQASLGMRSLEKICKESGVQIRHKHTDSH